jgi:hypothetical protein
MSISTFAFPNPAVGAASGAVRRNCGSHPAMRAPWITMSRPTAACARTTIRGILRCLQELWVPPGHARAANRHWGGTGKSYQQFLRTAP